MKFLLLLYDDAEAAAEMSAHERRAIVDEHIAFSRMLRERGAHVYSEPLDDPANAAEVPRSPGLVVEVRPIPEV